MELKDYQHRALETLQLYFNECTRIGNANTAFYETTRKLYENGIPYNPVSQLPELPYICLRIPTGGGKTLVACHSISKAATNLLYVDHPMIVWLVPSTAIQQQTLNALKDRKHPYRQALEQTLGAVTVLDNTEALFVQRSVLDNETTIIVSTIQAFRIEDTEGRKVYESSGALKHHFQDIPHAIQDKLDKHDGGAIIYSLANVMRIRRPLVIVDEAHNARTSLSFDTLARLNPSCILEFTATPDREHMPSNILHSVSAAELKAESMIKLPIRLSTNSDWKDVLSEAIGLREHLEELARAEHRETGEYIRPIMLIQAQPKYQQKESITVDYVKQTLIEDHKIPNEQIAIATGDRKELDNVDVLSHTVPIRFIITVQALKEGWDCPFAYALCSVAELSSSTAVEQILGRILRLPKATPKKNEELNMAYAFVSSPRFAEVLNTLKDMLIEKHGFERQEVNDLVTKLPENTLFSGVTAEPTSITFPEPLDNIDFTKALTTITEKITVSPKDGTITFKGIMTGQEREALKKCFPTTEGKTIIEQLYYKTHGIEVENLKTPAERREPFRIPVLAIKQGSLLEQFEATHFLDSPWQLSTFDATLTEEEYPTQRPEGKIGEVTVSKEGKVEARFVADLQSQNRLFALNDGWTEAELIYWLDRTIPHPDISPDESAIFLRNMIKNLIYDRGVAFEQLVLDKYRLRQAAIRKIEECRKQARKNSYRLLFDPEIPTPLVATPEKCFTYDLNNYPCNSYYHGGYEFKKHYYPQVGNLKDRGEEYECAMYIDMLPEVKYWVRNLDRRPSHSFWLQTSTDKFYPDFVCLLNDGRYLVVEYKGEDRWSDDDSKEKREIGELWEARSGGLCLFIMPKGKDFDAIRTKIKT